jgi:hypothetical protein
MTRSAHYRPAFVRLLLSVLAWLGTWSAMPPAQAGVLVIGNHTDRDVGFVVTPPEGEPQSYTLTAKDVLPLPVAGEVQISFDAGGASRRLSLDVNSAHYFAEKEGSLDLHRIGSAGPSVVQSDSAEGGDGPSPRPPIAPLGGVSSFYRMGVVPVMLLVDDEQQLVVRRVWETRLRERLKKASDVFERHCRFRFRVVKVGTWDSDDRIEEFSDALREFEREVIPDPAVLAIGFASQKYYVKRRNQMPRGGGTRGPLCRHVLIRESTRRMTERERVEVVLHELGHFLGAMHCREPYSAMRPVLGDGQARQRSFRLGFDPGNTLVMHLVASELRTGTVVHFRQLSADAKRRIRGVYTELAKAFPEDESIQHGIKLLEPEAAGRPAAISVPDATLSAARAVVQAIAEAAAENDRRTAVASDEPEAAGRLTGDALTEHYFRRAAAAAGNAPPDSAADGYLLGLAVGLDESRLLRDDPVIGVLYGQVESDEDRRRRLALLGIPTMRGRRDLMEHFIFSCGLTAILGPEAAERTGRMREVMQSQQGGRFRMADLLAHLSGLAFAERVRSGEVALSTLSESFRVDDFFPTLEGFSESLSWKAFLLRYGSLQDERFHRREAEILEHILALPGHQGP